MNTYVLRILAVLGLFASLMVGAPSMAEAQAGRDFFVSPSGSDNNSGDSIGSAVATLERGTSLIGPGDTLWVLDGTYRGFNGTVTGSAAAYARVAAYPGDTPVIDAGSGNGFQFIDSSYVELWGMEIRGDSGIGDSPNGAGVLMTGNTHHIRLVQNNVHHFGAGGIVAHQSGDHLEIYHNTVHNNANWSPDQHSGISLAGLRNDGTGNTGPYNNYIIGNLVYANEVKVTTDQYGGGHRITDGNCFIVDVSLGSNYTGKTLFGSNICVNNGGRGVQSFKSADVDVINNTFYYNMHTSFLTTNGSEVMAYGSTRVKFANNLIISRPGVLPLGTGQTTQDSFDRNLTVGTRDGSNSSTDRHLAHGTAVVENASTTVLTEANFTPRADSAAIDFGSADYTEALYVDFAGNHRSVGARPDAGAVERGATPANWSWNRPLSGPGGDGPGPSRDQPDPAVAQARTDAIRRLYSAAFLRAADEDGLEYWTGTNVTLIDIAYVFTISEEFINRYGELDDRGFIDRMYRNVLSRPPDQEGYDYWTRLMDDGMSRAELLLFFSDSAEFRSK